MIILTRFIYCSSFIIIIIAGFVRFVVSDSSHKNYFSYPWTQQPQEPQENKSREQIARTTVTVDDDDDDDDE